MSCAADNPGGVLGGPTPTGPWSPPAREVTPIATVLSTGDGLPLNPARGQIDGRGANRALVKMTGKWSSCRVYVDIPATWTTASDVAMCLVAITEGGQHEITGWIGVDNMGLELSGASDTLSQHMRGLALGVDGLACTGFQLLVRSKSNWTQQVATITMECWGDEGAYQVIAGAPACQGLYTSPLTSGIADKPFTMVCSGLMAFEPTYQKWRPVLMDTSGAINGTGSALQFGSTGGFNTNRYYGTVNAVTEFGDRSNAGGTINALGASDRRGSQYVLEALPDPSQSPTDSPSTGIDNVGRAVFKATPGYFLGGVVSNNTAGALYFMLINKASAPVGGETAVYVMSVPPNTTLPIVLPRAQYCSLGVCAAWSTTPLTLTVLGAGNPITNLQYV